MLDKENSNLGEEIQDIVQTAVSTMDFNKLNSEITTTVNTALSEVRQALGIVPVNRNDSTSPEPGTWRPVGPQRNGNTPSNLTSKDAATRDAASFVVRELPNISNPKQYPNPSNLAQRQPVPRQNQPPMQNQRTANRTASQFQREQTENGSRRVQPINRSSAQSGQKALERNPRQTGQEGFKGNNGQSGQSGQGLFGRTIQQARQASKNIFGGQSAWNSPQMNRTNQEMTYQRNNSPNNQTRRGVPIPYIPVGNISGTLLSVFGWIGTGVFGIAFFVMIIMAITTGDDVFPAIGFGMFIPTLISWLLMRRGGKIRKRIRRMKSYMKVLQVRGFSSVKELANATGSTEKFVRKDLRKMLSLGMFPEGQMDDTMTCFMATRASCEQYRIAQNGFEQREVEEKARLAEEKRRKARMARYQEEEERKKKDKEKEQKKENTDSSASLKGLSPEVRETIEHGQEYIRQIRKTNDAILEEDVSEKLDRLELVIDRIFICIERHPEQLPEIRKFMDYYLPTTLKLLKAYQEFDSQPVQGENIKTAKQEIRNTLDTINMAFENLLDSLFEDAAMDVSTDISVLQTMLKQEGLTGSEFEQAGNEIMK